MALTEAEKALAAELAVGLSLIENGTEEKGLSSTELTLLKDRLEDSDFYSKENRINPRALADIIRKPAFLDEVMAQSYLPEGANRNSIENRLDLYANFIDQAIAVNPDDLGEGIRWAEEKIKEVTPPSQTGAQAMAEIGATWEKGVEGFVAGLKP